MSASKLSDLLPIDTALERPNAYEVFGMRGPVEDPSQIAAAMKQVYLGLKTAKPTAEPEVWKQALKLAEAARKVLEDPNRRAALDASLGQSSRSPEAADPADPLAGLLPGTDPQQTPSSTNESGAGQAASVLGVPPPSRQTATALGTPPLGPSSPPAPGVPSAPSVQPTRPVGGVGGIATGGNAVAPGGAADPSSAIQVAPAQPTRRRKKSNSGTLVFGVFVVTMLGCILWLLHFLTSGNRIAVNQVDDTQGSGQVVTDPMPPQQGAQPTPDPTPEDGVLNEAPTSGIAESIRQPGSRNNESTSSGLAEVNPLATAGDSMTASPTATESAAPQIQRGGSAAGEPATTETTPMGSDGQTALMPESKDDAADMQAAQAKIQAVEQLIRSGDWDRMKPAADALLQSGLRGAQAERASALYDIADLATFYRGGIRRGLLSLQTGNTFEYVEGFQVIVVEATENSLEIQYNKVTKKFALDSMPPRLTERIAALTFPRDRPDAVAGLALYRLIRDDTPPEYRAQAFESLDSVDGQLESVDTESLRRTARELFSASEG